MTTTQVLQSSGLLRADLLHIFGAAVVLFVVSVVIQNLYIAFFGPLSKFPGPKSRAFSLLPWMRTTWNGTDNIDIPALHKKYGPVVRTSPRNLSFVGDAQVWKDIYGFRKSGQPEASKDPLFYGQNINNTPGLIMSDYHTHSRQRKIVAHAFSDKALKEQEPLLKRWAELFKTKLIEQSRQGQKTDMLKMLNCTTFDIMGDLTFAEPLFMLQDSEYSPWVKAIFGGIKFGTRLRVARAVSDVTKAILMAVLTGVPSLRAKQWEHWKYTTDRVDRRLEKEPDRPDLYSRILEKSQGPDGLTREEMYSISSLFMIAGTETTATALSGTTYHLLRNPKHMTALQNEIREAFSSLDDMHLDALPRLPILEATIKEGIRMYPPVPIGLPRLSPPGGMMVGDHFVPEGTSVAVHQMSSYRDDGNFKDAYEFHPERWMGDEKYANDNFGAYEPFSTGPRNCLGKNLAWHEMRLLLATVVLHFDLELCPESERWDEQRVFTLWEKPALMCRLTVVKE